MTFGKMKIKMATEGDTINVKLYDKCKVVAAEYNSNLNWWEYLIETELGNKTITNDNIIKNGCNR